MSDRHADPLIHLVDMLRLHKRLDVEEANALERAHLVALSTPPPRLPDHPALRQEHDTARWPHSESGMERSDVPVYWCARCVLDAMSLRAALEGAPQCKPRPTERCTFHRDGSWCGKAEADETVHVWLDERMRVGAHVWRHDPKDASGLDRPARPSKLRQAAEAVLVELDIVRAHNPNGGPSIVHIDTHKDLRAALEGAPADLCDCGHGEPHYARPYRSAALEGAPDDPE